MALVKYIGASPSVNVPETGATVLKGNSIEVSNEVATRLLAETGTWEAGNKETEELAPFIAPPILPLVGYQGEWDPRPNYAARILVTYRGAFYMSLKPTQGESPESHPGTWLAISGGSGRFFSAETMEEVEAKAAAQLPAGTSYTYSLVAGGVLLDLGGAST